MKTILHLPILLLFIANIQGQNPLYRNNHITSIYVEMHPDSAQKMVVQKISDRYLKAKLIVKGDTIRDTVLQVGIRLSGNTSLNSMKKSFKISFNEYNSTSKYRGLRKMVLRGEATDPTMIREYLFYTIWNKLSLPERRVGFARLYVNNAYWGLYTNIEEMDKEWIQQNYSVDSGNLYKCTWPADLAFQGTSQAAYKAIMHDSESRAYDLKTNESKDDYSDLVRLCTKLTIPLNANFENEIKSIIDVDEVLAAFAMDVCFGNWDDYFYLKNNYFLYFNPKNQRFDFITYDTDNSAGINWIPGEDWANRNALTWYSQTEARPLASKLLIVPAFRKKFVTYLDTINRLYTQPNLINPLIDQIKNLITNAAFEDSHKQLDFGYTNDLFLRSFDQPIDGHTPYGLKPFFAQRRASLYAQIGEILDQKNVPTLPFAVVAFPNPSSDSVDIQFSSNTDSPLNWVLVDVVGRPIMRGSLTKGQSSFSTYIGDLPTGQYYIRLSNSEGIGLIPISKH